MKREPRLTPPTKRLLLLAAAALLFAVLAWWPMMTTYPHTPELDGQYSFFQFEIGRAIILRFHELPLWNPFDCRGIPHWDFPESMSASPILLTTFWLPALYQYYLWNVLHCAVGFVGMWLLIRDDLRLSRIASLCAACLWAFGAAHTAQYTTGHEMMVGFWNIPLLLFLWRRGEHAYGYTIGAGIVMAWMIYDGGTYPVPYCALFLGVESLLRLSSRERVKKVVAGGAFAAVTTFLLAAPRLLPLVSQFSHHKRPNPYPDVDFIAHADNVRSMFLMRATQWNLHLPDQQYVWNEYISYLSYAGAFLAILGIGLSMGRRKWLVVLAIVMFVVMLGHFSPFSPWSILQKHVFPFTSMRVPSRFRFFVTAARGRVRGHRDRRSPGRDPAIVRRLARQDGADGARGARSARRGRRDGVRIRDADDALQRAAGDRVVASPRFYYGGPGLAPAYLDTPRQNRGWLGCRAVAWAFHENAPLWTGDVPQARAKDDGATVEAVRRTSSRFTFVAKVTRPDPRPLEQRLWRGLAERRRRDHLRRRSARGRSAARGAHRASSVLAEQSHGRDHPRDHRSTGDLGLRQSRSTSSAPPALITTG